MRCAGASEPYAADGCGSGPTDTVNFVNQNDCWVWQYEKNDSFSVRSAYRMLVETKMQCEDWLRGATKNSNREEEKNWRQLFIAQVCSIID